MVEGELFEGRRPERRVLRTGEEVGEGSDPGQRSEVGFVRQVPDDHHVLQGGQPGLDLG